MTSLETRYLIVGGGMTADAACKGIREVDRGGSIIVVGEETHPPYARPPLTKGLWYGKDEDEIWRGTDGTGAELILGRRIVSVDLLKRQATDDANSVYRYERLLLATGGRPRRLEGDDGDDTVVYFRTLGDYWRLREQAHEGARAVVVGGGFIGSELAAALATNGCLVTMAFPEQGIGARLFPPELARFLNDYYRERGVDVRPGTRAERVERADRMTRVLTGERALEAEVAVAGLGIRPRVELVADAGLEVANGIAVDEFGRVGGRHDVYAAGDVAVFPMRALATATRVEHEDHANSHGRCVGRNMAGASQPYHHLPFFYSDLFDLGYEAVGEVDARLATIVEWSEPNQRGVVYYVDRERHARGILLWNVWERVDEARALIASGTPVQPGALEQ